MSSRSVHATKAKVNPIPFTALPEDVQKGHIPIIAVDYKDKDLAKEKELIIDFETGNLYIVSKDDDTVLINLLEVLAHDYLTNINGSKTWVTISGIEGAVNLSSILNEINKYKIEHLVAEDEDTAIKGRIDSIRYDDKSIEEKLFVLLKDFDEAGDLAIPRKTEDGTGIEWMTAKDIGLDPSEPTIGARKNIIDILPTPREPDQNVFVLYTKPYARSTVEVEGTYYVRLPKSIPTYHTITWKVTVKKKTVLIFDDNIDWYPNTDSSGEDIHTITIYPNGNTYIGDPPTVEPSIPNGTSCNIFFYISTWDKGRRWQISLDKDGIQSNKNIAIFTIDPIMNYTFMDIITVDRSEYEVECIDNSGETLSRLNYPSGDYTKISIPMRTTTLKLYGNFTKIVYNGLQDGIIVTSINIPKMPLLEELSGVQRGLGRQATTIQRFSLGENNLSYMEDMFYDCQDLTVVDELYIPSTIDDLSSLFYNCSSLISIPLLDTANVTDMSSMFFDCMNLTSVQELDTSNVINMNSMFAGCMNLTSIPEINTSNVTDMENTFFNCESLSGGITIRNTDTIDYENMFYGCSSNSDAEFIVKYIDARTKELANKMVDTKLKYYDHVYLDVGNLYALFTIATPTTTGINHTINCRLIDGYDYRVQCLSSDGSILYNEYYQSGIDISLGLPIGTNSFKLIGDFEKICYAGLDGYYGNITITGVNVPKMPSLTYFYSKGTSGDTGQAKTIKNFFLGENNLKDLGFMFDGCSQLTFIQQLDTSKATDMGAMFQGCSQLTTIPLLDTSNVTDMGAMFYGCRYLTSIPQLDTSKTTIMRSMFYGCSQLTSIPQLNTSKATTMESMFRDCSKLTTIPEMDTSNVTKMSYMFTDCNSLVSIPQLNTSKVTDMRSMFNDCTSLANISNFAIIISKKVDSLFRNCESLSGEIKISYSEIDTYANMFLYCSSNAGTKLVVNYIDEITKELAIKLIETKSSYSNVLLGTLVEP